MKKSMQRWLDFTRRFCFHAWPHLTDARKVLLWKEALKFIEIHPGFEDWDQTMWDEEYLCDSVRSFFYDDYGASITRNCEISDVPRYFYNQLICAFRAGIDSVSGDSGVVGFTIGDLKRMHDGHVPDWYADLHANPAAVRDAPDDATIWL